MVSNGIIKKIIIRIIALAIINTATTNKTATASEKISEYDFNQIYSEKLNKYWQESLVTPEEYEKMKQNPRYYTKIKLTSEWENSYGKTCTFKIVNQFLYKAEKLCKYYQNIILWENTDNKERNVRTLECKAGEGVFYPDAYHYSEARGESADQMRPTIEEEACHRWCNINVPESMSEWEEKLKSKYDKEKEGYTTAILRNLKLQSNNSKRHLWITLEGEEKGKRKQRTIRHLEKEKNQEIIKNLGGIEKIKTEIVYISIQETGRYAHYSHITKRKNKIHKNYTKPKWEEPAAVYEVIWDEPEKCNGTCMEMKEIKPRLWKNDEITTELKEIIKKKIGADAGNKNIKQIADQTADKAQCGQVTIAGRKYNDCMAAGLLKVMKYPIIIKLLTMTFKKI